MGLIKTVAIAAVLLGSFYIGYRMHEHVYAKHPYYIRMADSTPYVVEKSTGDSHHITNDFQLGTVEYRIEGLRKEGKLEEILGNRRWLNGKGTGSEAQGQGIY